MSVQLGDIISYNLPVFMKTFLRVSYDYDSACYVVDYRLNSGYYVGQKHTRTFKRFSDFVTFIIMYIFNDCLKNV